MKHRIYFPPMIFEENPLFLSNFEPTSFFLRLPFLRSGVSQFFGWMVKWIDIHPKFYSSPKNPPSYFKFLPSVPHDFSFE